MPHSLPQATERLTFRRITEADRDALRRLNADARVMRYFPKTMGDLDSDNFQARLQDHQNRFGFTLWGLEDRPTGTFVGLCGLLNFQIDAPFAPAVELGYRLRPEFWGQGYATEAARSVLRYGFVVLGLPEIVSFTARKNEPSWKVMERLGMHRDPAEDFDHPSIEEGQPLRRHVLYRLKREEFDPSLGPAPPPDPARSLGALDRLDAGIKRFGGAVAGFFNGVRWFFRAPRKD